MTEPDAATADLAYRSTGEILEKLKSRSVNSVELVENFLARMERIDSPDSTTSLRSIAATVESALEEAATCDGQRRRGETLGALHGVPVLIKDNIEAVGLPGAAGSTALRGRPTRDAPLVTRLRRAGAIVLGSTNLSQWANMRSPRSTSGWSATGGLVANPWALDRSAGGSSSGSGAAVAAGLSPLAVGTETDGSIVCPSSVNGIVGLKPTVGVVSTRRVVPISASQDSPGPMGRRVEDVAHLFAVLADQTRAAPRTTPPRLAFATSWQTGHPATDARIMDVVDQLRSAGATVMERDLPTPGSEESNDELTVLLCELVDDLGSYLSQREGEGVRSLADVVAYEVAHAEVELPFFGHEFFVAALETGGRLGGRYDEARARNLEWALTACLTPALADVDALIAPAYAPAWKSDLAVGGHPSGIASCVTMPAAIAGWPICSVPVGLVHGLPVGAALVGRPFEEWRLLEVARFVESVVDGALPRRPSWNPPARG